ncbi:zinc ABC transporter substrate-binding protein AztC [Hoyosella subflava]|uniref:Putative Mn2+/Zn2+ ABC-type transporter,substrate binding protein n=1 Tax=Hoyosella subflava (strain DSM 45089 / JCM 17490 / NBRC 109087 / DQS3-9A1) TaxID=443218 RepID=F6ER94_HOYSD|nr:zinc ABC transporter substrate-binding protein AztC [Hoyosella subflava]AEF41972.1 Putative Mn2+/Zn2+ ABC-type transporter,substrate binding protein [Hoyosella subflava DQS3-9A1]
MKMRVALAAALFAGGSLTACVSPGPDQPLVVVTTNILGDVVEEMVGDEAEVLTLMPPDADPHSFAISAQTAARMRDAELIVANGLGLEEGLAKHVESTAADGVPVFLAGDHIDVLDYSDGDSAGQPDSHFWTDPARMIDVVSMLRETLGEIEGIDQARLEEQASSYLTELESLDADMTAAFTAIPEQRRALVTNHHVFGYLADRFGFRIVGAVIPSGTTLAAPSASDLQGLITAIDEAGITTIFAESSQPGRLMEVLADEANRDVVVVELVTESLTQPDGDAPTYLDMMRVNTERIATGLAP